MKKPPPHPTTHRASSPALERPSSPEFKPRRQSAPEINAALEAHQKDRAKAAGVTIEEGVRQITELRDEVSGAFEGLKKHEKTFGTHIHDRLSSQDQAIVTVARAVGVPLAQLPPDLVRRSVHPPPDSPDATPAAAQKPVLPAQMSRIQLIALGIAFFEAAKGAIALVEYLLKHG